MTVTRPALRWHGGKWMLAPWIIGFFPPHRCYVEPFGGAASVLLRKERTYAEVYNDLDSAAVNLFRVLRDPVQSARLREVLYLTPFAREEFAISYQDADDPIECARRLIIRAFQGFGSNAQNPGASTGFRANSNRSGTTPAHDWANYPEAMPALIERLRGVIIENRKGVDVMVQHDSLDTLHYVDPPYVHSTRSRKVANRRIYHGYAHEMNDEEHIALIESLLSLKGMVVLSGYPCSLYDDALGSWGRHARSAMADGARERTEVVWLNPACVRALAKPQQQSLVLA